MMRNGRMLFAVVLAGMSLAFASIPASAILLFDNLGASPDGEDPISSFGPLEDSFSTGPLAVSLTDVKVRLNGDPASTGDISVSLLQDSGTAPGALISALGNISAASLGTDLVYDFLLGSPIPLAASTRYWIGLTTSNVSASWPWSLDVSGTGVASEFFANSSGVFPNVEGPYLMQVNANESATGVAEPATLALLGVGLAGLGFSRRKQ